MDNWLLPKITDYWDWTRDSLEKFSLEITMASNTAVIINGDSDRLTVAVRTLLTLACMAARRAVKVCITESSDKSAVEWQVTADGASIDPQRVSALVSDRWTGDLDPTSLPIVHTREIVELHHGKILAECAESGLQLRTVIPIGE